MAGGLVLGWWCGLVMVGLVGWIVVLEVWRLGGV